VSTVGNSIHEYPLITIGITCYNAERTIGRAIDSALRQEWPNLEVAVVDDRSTDGSLEVVRRYAERDGRIRWRSHESNKGYAAALNSVFESAKGEFVAIFDDDDVSRPDRLSRQWRRLAEYERATGAGAVLCYSNRDVFTEGAGSPTDRVRAIGRSATEPHGADVADFLLWHYEGPGFTWGQFGSCTLFVRTRTILDLGGFDETFRRSAEWDLAVRAANAGAHFIAVDEPLVAQHITRTPDKAGNLPLEYALKLREKHREYLESRRVYLASKAIAHSRYHYAKNRAWASRAFLLLACGLSPSRVLPNELSKWKRRKAASRRHD
jgi:glycosyltransferase involved in cell wall biosynthesis